MNLRSSFVVIVLLLAASPSKLSAKSVEKLHNEQVLVTQDALAPGNLESWADNRPSMIVYLAGTTAQITSSQGAAKDTPVIRGETVFEPAQTRSIKNTGSSELSFVRVEFLTVGKDETWGRTGLPPNYKVLLENKYARAYDIRIKAHMYEQRHTHHNRIVISLSGATLEHILPNGEKQPSTLKTGEIVWRPGATHVGHNTGSTDLWVIAIEPK